MAGAIRLRRFGAMSEAAKAVPAGVGGLGGLASLRLPDRSSLQALSKRSDLFFATAVMGILVVLIFPLPAVLLDLLLAVSIILSVLIMMTGLFIRTIRSNSPSSRRCS
jgi:flagellar biosynthesis protein FlhA